MKLERAVYLKLRDDLIILHIYRIQEIVIFGTQEFETKIIKLLIFTNKEFILFDLGKSKKQI
jgi:hypothetical protein